MALGSAFRVYEAKYQEAMCAKEYGIVTTGLRNLTAATRRFTRHLVVEEGLTIKRKEEPQDAQYG